MVWENDQDLRAMRQHVTEDFFWKFKQGKDQYLAGDWLDAIKNLKKADDIMITLKVTMWKCQACCTNLAVLL